MRFLLSLFAFFISLNCYSSNINWEEHEVENTLTVARLQVTQDNYSKKFEDLKDIEANWLNRLKELQLQTEVKTRQDQDRVFKELLKEDVIREHYFSLVIEGHRFWVPNVFLKFAQDSKKYKKALSSICYGKAPGSPISGRTMQGHHTAQMRYTPSKGFYPNSGYIPDIIIITTDTHHDESLHIQENGKSLIIRSEFAHAQKSLYNYIAKEVLNLKKNTLSPPEKTMKSKSFRRLDRNVMHKYPTRLATKKSVTTSPYKAKFNSIGDKENMSPQDTFAPEKVTKNGNTLTTNGISDVAMKLF